MELQLSSTCSSRLADDVDCLVVLRVGESQRLTRLGSSRAFNLPESALGGAAVSTEGKVIGRLDVLKCISSCTVAVDCKASAMHDLVLPCPSEPAIGEVRVKIAAEKMPLASDSQRSIEENRYLTEHGLQDVIAAGIRATLKERPGDPRRFLAEFILGKPLDGPLLGKSSKDAELSPLVIAPQLVPGDDLSPKRVITPRDESAPQEIVSELQALRQHCSRQDTILDEFHDSISQLVRDQPLTFTVLQYNILASYLGNNMEPWLLYGPNISEERRQLILNKHVEKGEDGKYANVGWPNYVKGILTEEEMKQVEDVHRNVFDWSVRRRRLLDNVASSNCDIIALEEMDQYEDFSEALKKDYSGLFRKRPRRSSKDGCAVFWRKSKFELAAFEGFDFADRLDKGGTALKDRTCLLVLLRWTAARYGRHESRVLVICTHLARNPEDPSQTKVRARQAAQLMKHLTEFSMQQNAIEVPVVLVGDLNAQHFGEVRGIARTVFQVTNHPCHNFLFRCADVPTGPTSMTDCRKVRIDAVMFQPQHLKVLGIHVPHLNAKIPDEVHPSDHVAVRVKFEVKADHLKMQECARSWLECVTGSSRLLPMTERELKRAFGFLDRDSTYEISKTNLQESILDLAMGSSLPPERQELLLDCFPNQSITFEEFLSAYEIKFDSSRMGNIGDLEQAFSFFDSDNDGKVTPEDVRTAFAEIVPIDFSETEIDSMMAHLSSDWGTGIDIHTFCEALCQINFNCSTEGSNVCAIDDAPSRTRSNILREKLNKLGSTGTSSRNLRQARANSES